MRLQPQARKTARLLKDTITDAVRRFGIEHLVFLTLTFDPKRAAREGWNPRSPADCQKKFKEFIKSFVWEHYGSRYIRIMERQKNGMLHYHVLIVVPFDARTGTDFEKLAEAEKVIRSGKIKSGEELFAAALNPSMRAFWATLGRWGAPGVATKAGFGIVRPEPIKSTGEAISKYVGKYVAKHIESRIAADKGVRLVEYGQPMRIGNTKFAWVSENARQWRTKLPIWAASKGVTDFEELSKRFGPRWAWHFKDQIMETELPADYVFPGEDCAQRYVEHRREIVHRDWLQACFRGQDVPEVSRAENGFQFGPLLLRNGCTVKGAHWGMRRSEMDKLIQQRKVTHESTAGICN